MHAMDIRPDVIIKTGVIQPYSITDIPPTAVARHVVAAFSNVAGGQGPQVRPEMGPEEFAARAKVVAVAMAAGKRFRNTDPKLIKAARMMMEGRPFTVAASGRVARVAGSPGMRALRSRFRGRAGGYWGIYGK